jgi:hypothetical protein
MDSTSALEIRAPAFRRNWRITPLRLGVALVLLALTVRAIGLGLRPLWLDEAYSAWFSTRGWHELWTVVPTYETHPPVYYSLLKLWRTVVGGDAVALRALSVLFGVLTVPVVIAVASEQERQDATGRPLLRAGFAGFLAACSPMLVLLDQEARPYPLLTFSYAVAILGLCRLMRQFSEAGAGKWSAWFVLALGTELTLWSHALGILYGLCLALALAPAWLRAPVSRARLLRGLVAATAVLVAYLPCLLMMAHRAGDWQASWLRWTPDALLQLAGFYLLPTGKLTAATAIVAVAMLLLIKRALQSAARTERWNSEPGMILLWLGPPLLVVLVSATLIPIFLPRPLTATLIPAYLAISTALSKTSAPRERAVLAAVICIILVPSAVQTALRPPTEQWDQVDAYLAHHVGPRDQVWLYPNDSALPLAAAAHCPSLRYATRAIPAPYPAVGVKGPIRAGSPAVPSLTPAQAEAVASQPTLRDVPTIWLVTRQIGLFDPKEDLASALARTRRPGATQDWGYIRVRPYYPKAMR